jgi:hypothetical protein
MKTRRRGPERASDRYTNMASHDPHSGVDPYRFER